MNPEHGQSPFSVRFDWGLSGAAAVATGCAAAVVVDVLSFSTTVSVGMDVGAEVLPFPWRDGVAQYAEQNAATFAVGRRAAGPGQVSLSPRTWRTERPARVVLPSPNGSTIAVALADRVPSVTAGCLRNLTATVRWLAEVKGSVCVIAAGETWPDGSLRPALEDLIGAGAILHGLAGAIGFDGWSPEALVTARGWATLGDLPSLVRDSASGRELRTAGFAEDVDIALEQDTSPWVPVLSDRTFRRLSPPPNA